MTLMVADDGEDNDDVANGDGLAVDDDGHDFGYSAYDVEAGVVDVFVVHGYAPTIVVIMRMSTTIMTTMMALRLVLMMLICVTLAMPIDICIPRFTLQLMAMHAANDVATMLMKVMFTPLTSTTFIDGEDVCGCA